MPVTHILSEIISEDITLNLVEPDIYSIYPIGDSPGAYDSIGASTIYDMVACNRFYNRLMWGYSIKDYAIINRWWKFSNNHTGAEQSLEQPLFEYACRIRSTHFPKSR